MSIITIRKCVTVFFTITVLMALNALIHQSVFTDFELCNSLQPVTTDLTDTNETFSVPSSSQTHTEPRISMKPLQDGVFSENSDDDSTSEIYTSFSQSDYEVPDGTHLNFEDNSEIPKENPVQSDFSTYSEKSHSGFDAQKSEFMCNAPWPFSFFRIFTPVRPFMYEREHSVSSLPPRSTVIIESQPAGEEEVPHISPFIEIKPEQETDSSDEDVKHIPIPPQETQSVAGSQMDLPPEYHIAPKGLPAAVPIVHEKSESPVEEELSQDSTTPPQKTPELELPAVGNETLDALSFESKEIPEPEETNPTFENESPPENFISESPSEPVSEPEEPHIAVLEDVGNFPLSEPEIVPINQHFGVKKPIVLPDVPQEKLEDLMIIDGVSELPEHSEPAKQFELRDFPTIE